jgi:hypothetical protein
MRVCIPKKFKIANYTWRVVYDSTMEDNIGETRYGDHVIAILPGLDPELEYHTFLHELVHVAFGELGWKRLNDDEAKVDALAGILHQYLDSKRGALE